MLNFDYKAPRTLSEAISMLSSKGEIRALAGGTDIIGQLKKNRWNADVVIDLKRIPELWQDRLGFD